MRKVREGVVAKLKILRSADEETIHGAYTTEMMAEMKRARQVVDELLSVLKNPRMHHEGQGWIMLSKDDVQFLREHLEELQRISGPAW